MKGITVFLPSSEPVVSLAFRRISRRSLGGAAAAADDDGTDDGTHEVSSGDPALVMVLVVLVCNCDLHFARRPTLSDMILSAKSSKTAFALSTSCNLAGFNK